MNNDTCRVENCNREIRLKRDSLCHAHYMQQRAGKTFTKPQTRIPAQGMTCEFPGCDKPVRSGGLCSSHYTQKRLGQELRPIARNISSTARDEAGNKQCSKCKSWRPETDYGNHSRNPDGLMRWCRPCMAEKGRKAHETGKRRNNMFGLAPGQYELLVEEQNGRCAICDTDDPGQRAWAVDHDHLCCPGRKACGKCIRGLLCHRCNLALGLTDDSPERLRRMINYLASPAKTFN